jgi:hypothetical protein
VRRLAPLGSEVPGETVRAETCERCGAEMRPSSNRARVEVRDDGILPLPYTVVYYVMYDFQCPRCLNRTSLVDDTQVYVRKSGRR